MTNKTTELSSKHEFQLKGSADLAFAVVVLASYFAMFSSLRETNFVKILLPNKNRFFGF